MTGWRERYVKMMHMYEGSVTAMMGAVRMTTDSRWRWDCLKDRTWVLSLFAMVMDSLWDEIRQEPPWTIIFADNIVIGSECREQLKAKLERWRCAEERRRMKVNRSKME